MSDLLSSGPRDAVARRAPTRGVVLAAVAALVAVGAVGLQHWPDGARGRQPSPRTGASAQGSAAPSEEFDCNQAGVGSTPRPSIDRPATAALVIGSAPSGGTLDRHDAAAATGPWVVVVRRLDGSLGRHGATVTFPVGGTPIGRPVSVGGLPGRVFDGQVTWPIAGGRARVRGDVGAASLVAIATATRVEGGRPEVRPPRGYIAVSTGPYRSSHLHEVRYAGAQLSTARTLPGLVYTGVAGAGGFEDMLYATSAYSCGTVNGHPAVVSPVAGGNGTLAWEVAPGLVGFVGYSGRSLTGETLGAVHRLAEQARTLDSAAWQATKPQVVAQINAF